MENKDGKASSERAAAGNLSTAESAAKKEAYNLEHMPSFIKDAPWYLRDKNTLPELEQQLKEKRFNKDPLKQAQERQAIAAERADEPALFHQRLST